MKRLEGWRRDGRHLGRLTSAAVLVVGTVTPVVAAQTISYGSKAGMEVDILVTAGLDSEHAVIHTRHSRQNAIAFCRDYAGKVTPACIREELAVPLQATISANCKTGRFTTPNGGRRRFEGLSKARIPIQKYRIVDLSTGVEEDGTSASGYSTDMSIFRALCPRHAPRDE